MTQNIDTLILNERERCCSIIYGMCESDNTAQRTVNAIRSNITRNTVYNTNEQNWITSTEKAIENIKNIMTSTKPYDEDFITLANFILTTDANPYSFMPNGWKEAKVSAQSMEEFLHVLHHNMIDDGEVCFISTELYGSCISFNGVRDVMAIQDEVDERYPITRHSTEYTVHENVQRFIKEVTDYEDQLPF